MFVVLWNGGPDATGHGSAVSVAAPNAGARVERARARLRARDAAGALRILRTALRGPGANDADVQHVHTRALLACETRDCDTELITAARDHPGSAVYMKGAAELLLLRDPESPLASGMFDILRTQLPDDAEAQLLTAEWLRVTNRTYEAEAAVRRIVTGTAEASTLWRSRAQALLGLLLEHQGRSTEARPHFEAGYHLARTLPELPSAPPMHYAAWLEGSGRHEDALSVTAVVLAHYPEFSAAHLLRARCFEALNRQHAAVRSARAALRTAAGAVELRSARVLLARLLFAAGNTPEAARLQALIERDAR